MVAAREAELLSTIANLKTALEKSTAGSVPNTKYMAVSRREVGEGQEGGEKVEGKGSEQGGRRQGKKAWGGGEGKVGKHVRSSLGHGKQADRCILAAAPAIYRR